MKRLKNGLWAIALVAVVLGMMVGFQFRVQQRITQDKPFQRSQELTLILQKVEEERDSLQQEVADLRDKLAAAVSRGQNLDGLAEELEQARMAAGLVEVRGPGVTVILDDSKRPPQPGEDPNAFILHDEDLLKVVNELAAGGAEAIAVNGQRLIGRSEIRCAGPTISINNVMTAPPVVIKAIGDPEVLESSLKLRGGVIDTLSFWGIEVSVKKEAEVIVPAYKGSLRFQFARKSEPAKEGGR